MWPWLYLAKELLFPGWGENGKGGGLANPSSVSKPIQSAQLLGHADLQEDALSPPPPPHDSRTHTHKHTAT